MFRNLFNKNISKKINNKFLNLGKRFVTTQQKNISNEDIINSFKISVPISIISMGGLYIYNQNKNFEKSNISKINTELKNHSIRNILVIDEKRAIFHTQDDRKLICDLPNFKYLEDNINIENIDIEFENNNSPSVLYQILLSLFIMGCFYTIMRKRMGNFDNIMQFSKNNEINIIKNINTKFEDIIGQTNAVNLIREYLDIIKNFHKYKKIGAKIPKGALLYGPPGTGKTLLAKALAGESNLPFVSLSGSDLNAMFVGVGAMKVKNLFREARKKIKENNGCIVFIDEIDAIGQKRGISGFNVNTERENTLNQLLTEMDGFDNSDNIMIIGATNRFDVLDNALIRPGRFDRKIAIELPNDNDRQELLKYYFSKINTNFENKESIIKTISKLCSGFSGADISNICNESAIISIRKNKNSISEEEVKEAIDYVMLGSEKRNLITNDLKETVAYHEAGHAFISCKLINNGYPIKVSIIPREKGMLGFSQSESIPEILITKDYIENQICVLMAGRICEEVFLDSITNGASNDIEKATDLIDKYINLFCMGNNKFYKIKDNENSFNSIYGNKIKDLKDEEILKIFNQLYEKTKKIIIDNREIIIKIKEELINKETIYKSDLEKILENFNILKK